MFLPFFKLFCKSCFFLLPSPTLFRAWKKNIQLKSLFDLPPHPSLWRETAFFLKIWVRVELFGFEIKNLGLFLLVGDRWWLFQKRFVFLKKALLFIFFLDVIISALPERRLKAWQIWLVRWIMFFLFLVLMKLFSVAEEKGLWVFLHRLGESNFQIQGKKNLWVNPWRC